MLLSLPDLIEKYDMKIDGVLHLGAHLGEEAAMYEELGVGPIWWVEANPFVLEQLAINLHPYGQQFIHACVDSIDGVTAAFNVTNYDGMSSSLLEFGTHPTFSPDTVFEHRITVTTTTVDTLVGRYGIKANFLNMDLQGAELRALAGGIDFLAGVDYINTEVNTAEVYIGCAKVDQLDTFLHEFDRVETCWVDGQGWGDALYVRRA